MTRQSQRRAGISVIASTLPRMFDHSVRASGAPGRMQAIPMIAMSAGGGGGASSIVSIATTAASSSPLAVDTSAWRSASVITSSRRVAT